MTFGLACCAVEMMCTTRCPNPGMWCPWGAVPMAVATTTTPTRLFVAVTELCQWTSMCQAARPRPRRCSTASCSCSGRSNANRS
ncbi:NADH dehydrogenase (ubiquinone) Fe-S protein 7, isoform CRA_e [Rattus norvegicus]|uniref:NADH dehydrogenase (Ubiquinone) Fe-S protein 7, isoform CRA_e n=1 Tax=Rattus norvegicus TaxID=10116 RepID=A6K8N9_RAT|nr:NADH dehydrogenase (ubiquinone) Fe-S protein 7, isoform CRA_e [Rattus norvegicus]